MEKTVAGKVGRGPGKDTNEPEGAEGLPRDRYRVLGELATGETTRVFEVQSIDGGRIGAAKILRRPFADDPRLGEALLEEGKTLASVKHANVVQVLDVGTSDDGVVYLVLERLTGSTLEALLSERRTLGIDEARHIADELLAGIGALHAAGIVHRSLHPSHVFLHQRPDGSETVKLLGLGMARRLRSPESQVTDIGQHQGDAAYASPEQREVDSIGIDERTDLYAVGALIYSMVVGQPPPFVSSRTRAPALQSRDESVPIVLIDAVARALSYSRDSRFARSAEMRRALFELSHAHAEVDDPPTLERDPLVSDHDLGAPEAKTIMTKPPTDPDAVNEPHEEEHTKIDGPAVVKSTAPPVDRRTVFGRPVVAEVEMRPRSVVRPVAAPEIAHADSDDDARPTEIAAAIVPEPDLLSSTHQAPVFPEDPPFGDEESTAVEAKAALQAGAKTQMAPVFEAPDAIAAAAVLVPAPAGGGKKRWPLVVLALLLVGGIAGGVATMRMRARSSALAAVAAAQSPAAAAQAAAAAQIAAAQAGTAAVPAAADPTPAAPVAAAPDPAPVAKAEPKPAPVAKAEPKPAPVAAAAPAPAPAAKEEPKPVPVAKAEPKPAPVAKAEPAPAKKDPKPVPVAKREPKPAPVAAKAEPKPEKKKAAKPVQGGQASPLRPAGFRD